MASRTALSSSCCSCSSSSPSSFSCDGSRWTSATSARARARAGPAGGAAAAARAPRKCRRGEEVSRRRLCTGRSGWEVHVGRSVAACGSLVEAATALAQNHVDVHHAALLHVEGARVQLGDLLLAADGAVHAEVAGPAADAAGAAGAGVAIGQATASGPINSFANVLEQFLKLLQDRLRAAGVRNSSGLSIIALTACVKALTFPFTKMQVESSLAIQALQPRIKEIRRVFDGDRDKISAETSKLYQDANVNQSAGCLPLLLTWPVFIGLYRCFTTAANDGLFDESFLWIPTLAGPTTIESRSAGLGLAWLLPLAQDGAPPIGWHDALLYLSLPAALIASQYASQALVSTTPPPEEGEDQQWLARSLVKVLPLMVGYFALNVPAGLGLYWLTNNVLTTGQQVYLRNFGGASVNVVLPDQKLKYGTAIRSGLKADPAAMQIISAFDGDGGVGAAAEGEARAAANTIPAARDVPEPNSNGSGAREAVVDLQSTRRAKRLRIGRIMQVYTESQTRGPEGKAISAELET